MRQPSMIKRFFCVLLHFGHSWGSIERQFGFPHHWQGNHRRECQKCHLVQRGSAWPRYMQDTMGHEEFWVTEEDEPCQE